MLEWTLLRTHWQIYEVHRAKRKCSFKQIVPRLMEEDNVISYEEALKMVLLRSLEWFALALTTISSVFLLKQLASSPDLLFDS